MFYEKYLTIPYKKRGRSEQGADCWGLIGLILQHEYNIDVLSDKLKAVFYRPWERLESPEPNCLGVCKLDGLHAVFFIDSKMFIEMTSYGVVVAPYSKYKNEFIRFYRIKPHA